MINKWINKRREEDLFTQFIVYLPAHSWLLWASAWQEEEIWCHWRAWAYIWVSNFVLQLYCNLNWGSYAYLYPQCRGEMQSLLNSFGGMYYTVHNQMAMTGTVNSELSTCSTWYSTLSCCSVNISTWYHLSSEQLIFQRAWRQSANALRGLPRPPSRQATRKWKKCGRHSTRKGLMYSYHYVMST